MNTRVLLRRRRARDARPSASAAAAVREERLRIARDLHDLAGRGLWAITLQAQLAERLQTDPARTAEAAEVMRSVGLAARRLIVEIRESVHAYRSPELEEETAAARELLRSAGIEPRVPLRFPELSPSVRQLFAWTVREAVTNVVRHSGASRCVVTVSPLPGERVRLTVQDDGRGCGHPERRVGDGLRGLRERATAAGADVTVSSRPGHGYRVTVGAPR